MGGLAAKGLQACLGPVELEKMADVETLVTRVFEMDLYVDGEFAPTAFDQLKWWRSFWLKLFDRG